MQDYPFIRELHPPLSAEQLRPLDVRCQVVQFRDPLSDDELQRVAEFLRPYPGVVLRVYGHATYSDLDFLRHFPEVLQVQLNIFELTDVSGVEQLTPRLSFFGFGQTRRRFSIRWLERFAALDDLWLEGHSRDIDVVAQLVELRRLSLRSITLPDLRLLRALASLEFFELKLGGTRDLRGLEALSRLRYFEAWMVRGLADLGPIAQVVSLEHLFLQTLKHVTAIPSLDRFSRLRRVHIETMKGLTDLTPVAAAPALKELLVLDMPHLKPQALSPFVGHRTLQRATVGLGSTRKNAAVRALLGLQDVNGRSTIPAAPAT